MAAKTPKRMITQNVRLDHEMMAELKEFAELENRSISNLIHTMIRDGLALRRAEREAKEKGRL